MLRNRFFNVLIAIALILLTALTVREAFATTAITSPQDAVTECAALPSHSSIHTKYVKDAGVFMLYTEDGPTGVDGGLLELMSSYRDCR